MLRFRYGLVKAKCDYNKDLLALTEVLFLAKKKKKK